MRLVKTVIILFSLSSISFSQIERWVYQYNGTGNNRDEGSSIVFGVDGNIYLAGMSIGNGSDSDFVVISLTSSGQERWVYRYNGIGNSGDKANSLVYGLDGNIYAAGFSNGDTSQQDLLVVSLTTSGNERWVYRYNGSGNAWDVAYSIVYGEDGNIYIAGSIYDASTSSDFTVISLTSNGNQCWIYRYNGLGNGWDKASSLVYGNDGNIYVAGFSLGSGTYYDFTVISLTSNGSRRWVYWYNGPGIDWDDAYSITYGADGNIYVAGMSYNFLSDIIVISLTAGGNQRWIYRYNGPGNNEDIAYSIIYGLDDNLYVAGKSEGYGTEEDLVLISLTPSGSERWVYRYNGSGISGDIAYSVVYGSDGNIYSAGRTNNIGTHADFTLVSLTSTGSERWIYKYNGSSNQGDEARSLVNGPDGNIYAAGLSNDSLTYVDLTVISLDPTIGIEEQYPQIIGNKFYLSINTFQNQNLVYSLSLPKPSTVSLFLYNLSGQKILSWQISASQDTSQYAKILPNLSRGVYFLKAEVLGKGYKDSKKLIFLK
jgi:uncharacterized delta-60 repeat protein